MICILTRENGNRNGNITRIGATINVEKLNTNLYGNDENVKEA